MLGFVLLSSLQFVSAAGEEPPVVVVAPPSSGKRVADLRSELELAGFESVEVPAESASTPDQDARSGIVIVVSESPLRVLLTSFRMGEVLEREELVHEEGKDFSVVVIQAVEFVRAATLYARSLPPPDQPKVPPAVQSIEPAPEPTPDPRTFTRFDIGTGVLWAPGGLPVLGTACISVRHVLRDKLLLHVTSLIPLHSGRTRTEQTRVTVYPGLLALGVGARVALAEALAVEVAVGAGAVWFRAEGQSVFDAPRQGAVWSFAGTGQATLSWSVHELLEVRIEGMVGAAPSRPVALARDEVVAAWGQPFVAGIASLGVPITW